MSLGNALSILLVILENLDCDRASLLRTFCCGVVVLAELAKPTLRLSDRFENLHFYAGKVTSLNQEGSLILSRLGIFLLSSLVVLQLSNLPFLFHILLRIPSWLCLSCELIVLFSIP